MSLAPVLEATAITKQFPGVRALDGVSLQVHAGEVVAVVGENGAGKSTLMKVLAGVYQPDSGALHRNGVPIHFDTPLAAMRAGISLIHQELNLAENLSVADNLFLGREPTWGGPLRFVDRATIRHRGTELLQRVGLDTTLLPHIVGRLPPGQKQLVEIARALGLDAKVLIMDEPTSSLTQRETDRLYTVIDNLKAAGVSVVYISHRLAEVTRVAGRAVVLRDGRLAGELAQAELTHENLVRLMVGRDLHQFFPREHRQSHGPERLTVSGLRWVGSKAAPATFAVRAGEVFGMAGLIGAGRTELAEAIFGVRAIATGEVRVDGQPIRVREPRDAIHAGVLLVPEDRRLHGLVIDNSVGFNLSLPNLHMLSRTLLRLIVPQRERAFHQRMIARLRIRTPTASQRAGLLSGGNQQKIVFARWLARGPAVLILDEPTRGVDVGAKAEIYQLIDELAGQGVAILMISSDMEELLGMSDRVIVLHEGRVAGELSRDQLSEVAVMRLATGGASE
ncbi:MAG: sugar ABC transporter ATP-binding protein [Bacteroidales bacterium]|nr:sugar ABC transporter ATP-binding protein [Bacteroidales bacterium]